MPIGCCIVTWNLRTVCGWIRQCSWDHFFIDTTLYTLVLLTSEGVVKTGKIDRQKKDKCKRSIDSHVKKLTWGWRVYSIDHYNHSLMATKSWWQYGIVHPSSCLVHGIIQKQWICGRSAAFSASCLHWSRYSRERKPRWIAKRMCLSNEVSLRRYLKC